MADEGRTEKNSTHVIKYAWCAIENVVRNKQFIFIYVSRNQALIIPKRIFTSPLEANTFFGYACHLRQQARG